MQLKRGIIRVFFCFSAKVKMRKWVVWNFPSEGSMRNERKNRGYLRSVGDHCVFRTTWCLVVFRQRGTEVAQRRFAAFG